MKTLRNVIKHIDLTNIYPGFHFQGKEYYKSSIGGLFTLIYLCILFFLMFTFGRDFFFRLNPTLVEQEIYSNRYPNYTINNNNFSFSIRIEDNDGYIINNTKLIYLEFIYYHYQKVNGEWKTIEEFPLNYSNCKIENFQNKEHFNNMHLDTAICPDTNNIEFGGFWDETYIKFIRSFLKQCLPGKTNNNGEACGTQQEFNKMMDN